MANPRVAILGKTFVEWSGGVDFITYIANAVAVSNKYEVFFFVPDNNDALHLYEYGKPRKIKQRLVQRYKKIKPTVYENPAKPQLGNLVKNIKIVYYRNTLAGFMSGFIKHKIDVVLPSTETLGGKFPTPWIGYIWDFQHKHLPEYFSVGDIKGRDHAFKAMLSESSAMLVNSQQTKKDTQTFYPSLSKHKLITALPFAPSPDPEWLDIETGPTQKKYKLAKPYLIICNQFWLHKSHLVAIKAFAKVAKKYPDLDLVCTGKMEEPRDPNYINIINKTVSQLLLQKKVHMVGFVSKDDQIGLLKGAEALIQPTLYEGGPGGGAAYNAVALGVSMVISDIPINKEIKNPGVTFFKAGSETDLAVKIEAVLALGKQKHSKSELKKQGKENLELLSKTLSELIETTLVTHGKG